MLVKALWSFSTKSYANDRLFSIENISLNGKNIYRVQVFIQNNLNLVVTYKKTKLLYILKLLIFIFYSTVNMVKPGTKLAPNWTSKMFLTISNPLPNISLIISGLKLKSLLFDNHSMNYRYFCCNLVRIFFVL